MMSGYTHRSSSLPSSPDIPDPSEMLIPTDPSSSTSPRPSSDRMMGQEVGGARYDWILDHILTYPATYEIPLRTMYTLNSSPRAQPLPPSMSRPTSEQSRRSRDGRDATATPTSLSSSLSDDLHSVPSAQQEAAQIAAKQFKCSLMAQIAHLPNQPCSLPPSFITSFVRRCFPEDLGQVDFPQALTGMDYLRDFDIRRRRELVGALRRLGIDRDSLGADGEEKTSGNPAIAAWVKSVDQKERRVEALYTQVYIGLRLWVCLNQSFPSFNYSSHPRRRS